MRALPTLLILVMSSIAYAEAKSDLVDIKTKSDLEEIISKVLSREDFLVQVSSSFETVSEKKLIEGETVVLNNPSQDEVRVPPLPGFQPAPTPARQEGHQQNRQVYRMVEREVLKSISANIILNSSVETAIASQVKGLVRSYFQSNFGQKGASAFSTMKMMTPAKAEAHEKAGLMEYLPWMLLVGTVVLLALAYLLKFVFLWSKPKTVYPTIVQPHDEEVNSEAIYSSLPAVKRYAASRSNAEENPLALPSGGKDERNPFLALPATREFADRRTELMDSFMKNSEIFRTYYSKLVPDIQREIYAGLRGPAFDSFMETLGLEVPTDANTASPPSEDQMIFYLRNFEEFIAAQKWQHRQFFGFLRQLTLEQLITLIKQENPLISALILKFTDPIQSGKALSSITSAERTEIFSQFARISQLSVEELSSIEKTVREHVSKLPLLQQGFGGQDIEFWSKLLSETENQEDILLDIERSRPDLYPLLTKYRFQLDDIRSLPQNLVSNVLNEVDSEQLALGLLSCSKDVIEFVLEELNPNRRQLLGSQLLTLSGMPEEKIKNARKALTLRFREVMA